MQIRNTIFFAIILLIAIYGCDRSTQEQPELIPVNEEEVFLSGGNIAWISFADDIGPGETDLETFEEIFREVSEHGGNTMRMWLHTNGRHTPQWDGHEVAGPGEETIEDLQAILDLAYENDVMLMLCLWSFDMLREEFGEEVTSRARTILTEEEYMQSYIDNALTPMVRELQGHPGILSWEIFNEPEGMSREFGWDEIVHPDDQVPMADIQRFINRSVAAIREADPQASVTSGTWSFFALSDYFAEQQVDELPPLEKLEAMELEEVQQILHDFGFDYNRADTEVFLEQYEEVQNAKHYYTDQRLIEQGGEETGVLDYYTVHYYDWAGTILSPFHYDYEHWGLDKPTAVAEFYVQETLGYEAGELYETLYENGYAGALGWQWFDAWADRDGLTHNWPNSLENMEIMRNRHPEAVSASSR